MSIQVIPFPAARGCRVPQGQRHFTGPGRNERENLEQEDYGPFARRPAAIGVSCIYQDFRACAMRRLIASCAGDDPVSLLYRYFAAVEDGLRRRHATSPGGVAVEACVIELLGAAQSGNEAALSARLCWLVRRDRQAPVRATALAAGDALSKCGAKIDPVTEPH